jgi:RNA polymerase subunit RPABC4/transcription elongation factor Spt4
MLILTWFWILTWLTLAVVVGIYAHNKGLSGVLYFFISLVFSPLVGFLIVSERKTAVIAERTGIKKCPDCAEVVKTEALLCPFCGHKFSNVSAVVSQEEQSQKDREPVQQQIIANLERWAPIALTIFAVYIAVFLLVRSGYVAIAVTVVFIAVLLLAFHSKFGMKRPARHI